MSQKFLNPVEVNGQVSAEYIDLSTSTSHSVNAGEIAWNSIDGTFDIGLLNGVTLQAGQEMHFYGKATEAISNGNAVMFAGVQGDHILIAKADAVTINTNPEYFMGVATQDFSTNDFGYVTAFGNVRGIDTSTYSLGDILYYDSTSATDGLLTPIIPLAPKAKIIVAAVVKVHATQGILAVRPHTMPRLKDIQDINIDTASAGEILQLQSDGVWENKTLSEAGIQPTLTNPVTGTGTTNYVSKFTGTTSLGNSQIFDNGTNVGIGTTSPSYKLDLGVSNGMRLGSLNIVDGGSQIAINSSLLRIYSAGGVKLSYFNGTSIVDGLLMNSSGNVGIGTTSPGARLDVVGLFDALPARILRHASYGEILRIGRNGVTETASINYPANGVFAINTNSTERMRIDANGNVGIGTTSPSTNLHVLGNSFSVNPSARITHNPGFSPEFIELSAGVFDGGGIISVGSTSSMIFKRGSNESMRINGSGNVGIGTSSPSAKLDVNGDVLINGLAVGRGGGSISSNTTIGINALSSNSSGQNIIAVGRDAVTNLTDVDGLTVIGVDANRKPDLTDLESNSIVINQFNPDFGYGQQVPHFYAPDKIYCPINFVTDLLTIDYSVYTAAFLEYSIYNSGGDQFRAGRFVAAFKGTGTPVYQDYSEVVYNGTTLAATFTLTGGGGNNVIVQLENYDSDDYIVRFTSRLLMR